LESGEHGIDFYKNFLVRGPGRTYFHDRLPNYRGWIFGSHRGDGIANIGTQIWKY